MGPFSHCSLTTARVPDKPNAYNKSLLPLWNKGCGPLPPAQPIPMEPASDPLLTRAFTENDAFNHKSLRELVYGGVRKPTYHRTVKLILLHRSVFQNKAKS